MPPTVTNWVREKAQVRRLRREAYVAARVGSLFGDGNSTYADLALLRALTLERELRLASLAHSRESVAAMTRGVVESVLRGLFVLAQPDGVPDRLGAEALGHMRKFSFFGEPEVRDFFERFSDTFAEESQRGMPGLRQIAETVDAHHKFQVHTGQGLGAYLYHDWYLPLSNLSVHSSSATLARYYKVGSAIIVRRPWQVIPRRGAIRVADGATAYLLAAILETRDEDAQWALSYAKRQIGKANVPIVMLFGRIILGQGLGTLARAAYVGVRNRAALDANAPKERRILAMRALLRTLDPDMPDDQMDRAVTTLLDEDG